MIEMTKIYLAVRALKIYNAFMKRLAQILRRIVLASYLVFIHILAAMFIYHEFITPYFTYDKVKLEVIQEPAEKEADFPTPQPFPSIVKVQPPAEFNANVSQNNADVSTLNQTLMIPVVGIKREELQDTYNDARSEGRVHDAIDIIAPGGTPVTAVSDGEIARFFDSERGGITIYQFSSDKHFVYYYAHLQKRAENLQEHDFVKQGTIIGYVGDTGNAGEGNYHLHFEIMIPDNTDNYWKGTDVNPYPLLKNGIESH